MLTSLQNPMVKQFRKLHRSKERKRQGLCLLEGTNLLSEACAKGLSLQAVCCTYHWQQSHPDLWQEITSSAQRSELVSDSILAAIATTVNPDGVVAIAAHPLHDPKQLASYAGVKLDFLGVAVETLQDPGNLGTMIRTAMAADVDGLWISHDSVDPTHPKVLRASVGQWFRLSMSVSAQLTDTITALQAVRSHAEPASSLQVIATCPEAELSYWDVDYTQPSLIMVGNEGAGLSPALMTIATHRVQIPLSPHVESLNAAIATALVLYEAKRQRSRRH